MSAPIADKALAERLARLAEAAQGDGLGDGWPLKNALTEAHRSGQLITLAEADAMVAAERERCAAFCESYIVGHTTRGLVMDEWEKDVHGGTHAGLAYAVAIRGGATDTREGE